MYAQVKAEAANTQSGTAKIKKKINKFDARWRTRRSGLRSKIKKTIGTVACD